MLVHPLQQFANTHAISITTCRIRAGSASDGSLICARRNILGKRVNMLKSPKIRYKRYCSFYRTIGAFGITENLRQIGCAPDRLINWEIWPVK
jgi:hypothetical protein